MPIAYFLASKFDAHHGRGSDPRTSHDLEDIIYVLDNRVNLVKDILSSPESVLTYLQSEFLELLTPKMEEAILGHMNPFSKKERFFSRYSFVVVVGFSNFVPPSYDWEAIGEVGEWLKPPVC